MGIWYVDIERHENGNGTSIAPSGRPWVVGSEGGGGEKEGGRRGGKREREVDSL